MTNSASHVFLYALIALFLASCASAPLSPADQAAKADALRAIECGNKATCDLYWQRAQLWIARNSSWRIQTANDVLIQTFGPGNHETTLAYSVVRENHADGSATIFPKTSCDNMFGCEEVPWRALLKLKSFVTQTQK